MPRAAEAGRTPYPAVTMAVAAVAPPPHPVAATSRAQANDKEGDDRAWMLDLVRTRIGGPESSMTHLMLSLSTETLPSVFVNEAAAFLAEERARLPRVLRDRISRKVEEIRDRFHAGESREDASATLVDRGGGLHACSAVEALLRTPRGPRSTAIATGL